MLCCPQAISVNGSALPISAEASTSANVRPASRIVSPAASAIGTSTALATMRRSAVSEAGGTASTAILMNMNEEPHMAARATSSA